MLSTLLFSIFELFIQIQPFWHFWPTTEQLRWAAQNLLWPVWAYVCIHVYAYKTVFIILVIPIQSDSAMIQISAGFYEVENWTRWSVTAFCVGLSISFIQNKCL